MAERKASQNGKYTLITYLVEHKGLTMQQIIHLTPQEALDLLPSDDKELMAELAKYMKSSIKRINDNDKKYFFPGLKGPASERSLLHELHFHLAAQGRKLSDIGLQIRPKGEKVQKKEPEKPEDVMSWAKDLLK